MLGDKITFKMEHVEWVQICAHLKAPQVNAVVTPHERNNSRMLQLLTLAVLNKVTSRLDVKLAVFRPQFTFSILRHEALAILVANKHGFFQYNLYLQTLINQIDRQV